MIGEAKMIGNSQKENPSAERLRRLLKHLECERSIRLSEVAALLHVSRVTASQYVSAMLAGDWIALGRENVYDAQRDRKLRLRADWRFRLLQVGGTHIRTLAFCPATGTYERQSIPLCDAIANEEALSAALHRVLSTWEMSERTESLLGVILEDGVTLSDAEALGISPVQVAFRDVLTEQALMREYASESVLYVRYGEQPSMRLIAGGVPLPSLRPDQELKKEWAKSMDVRITAMARHVSQVLEIVIPDAVVLEADGVHIDAVVEAMRIALAQKSAAWSEVHPRLIPMREQSLAETEMLDGLHLRLAEQILREGKKR